MLVRFRPRLRWVVLGVLARGLVVWPGTALWIAVVYWVTYLWSGWIGLPVSVACGWIFVSVMTPRVRKIEESNLELVMAALADFGVQHKWERRARIVNVLAFILPLVLIAAASFGLHQLSLPGYDEVFTSGGSGHLREFLRSGAFACLGVFCLLQGLMMGERWFMPRVQTAVQTVVRGAASAVGPNDEVVRVLHLSDLHITRADNAPTIEYSMAKGDWKHPRELACPNPMLRRLIEELNSQVDPEPDMILITGDLTDRGDPGEFRALDALLGGLNQRMRDKLVALPGNHDININGEEKLAIDWPDRLLRARRKLGTLKWLIDLQGRRAQVWDNGSLQPLDTRSAPLAELRASANRLFSDLEKMKAARWVRYALGPLHVRQRDEFTDWLAKVERLWEGSFPMAVTTSAKKLVVMMCDSLGESTFIASNAVGRVRGREMRRLREMVTHYRAMGHAVCFGLHHHVARIVDDKGLTEATSLDDLRSAFLVLRNASEFLAVAEAPALKSVVFHGHRHIPKRSKRNNLWILGASSSTLPDHENTDHELAVQWSLRVGAAPRGANREVKSISIDFVATHVPKGSDAGEVRLTAPRSASPADTARSGAR